MKTLLTFALLTASAFSFAQTDIIEMKSRNASLKKYECTSKIKGCDRVTSNFGMRAMEEVKNAILDSVVSISDSVAIMYTSEYCTGILAFVGDYPRPSHRDSVRNYGSPRGGSLWEPGADTVVNHHLFSHKHSLDSVKQELDKYYYFNLPSDSTIFIGFDNAQSVSNRDAVKEVKHKRKSKKNGFGWELLFMIVTPIAFLFGMNRIGILSPN